MAVTSSNSGIGHTANHWSRQLGVSLRPWSGQSPVALMVRGAIQLAISAIVIFALLSVAGQNGEANAAVDPQTVRRIALVAAAVAALFALVALARLAVGLFDLVTRREVVGTVLDIRHRKTLDMLPRPVQQLIFERNTNRLDRRRRRTEVVLDTDHGIRQWTVRNARALQQIRPGQPVRMSVTPIAGHVSRVEPLPR